MRPVTSYPQVLGLVVRRMREERGWSQRELALKVGRASVSGWSRVESGVTSMTVVDIRRLARAFDLVKPGDLLSHVDSVVARLERVVPPVEVLDAAPELAPGVWVLSGRSLGDFLAALDGK